MSTQKIEGYWYSELEKQYPMPIPNVLSEAEAEKISQLIEAKERTAKQVSYRGPSRSRIEPDKYVGCSEFQTETWKWPVALRTHYVLEHKVKPTDEFLKYIGYIK